MDHRAFISSLTVAEREKLLARSDLKGGVHLLVYMAALLLSGAVILLGGPLWWLAVFPQALLLGFLFNLQHECTHKTPFHSSVLNEVVGYISGFLILQPFLWFRYFHLAHHRYTNDPQKDPELVGARQPDSALGMAFHISCLGYWASKISTILRLAMGNQPSDYVPEAASRRVQQEARLMVVAYLGFFGLASAFPSVLWVWPGPLVIGFPILKLYHLAEHGKCAYVADMFENSRTVLCNPIVRFVTWNMPFHAEHHAMPMVPFFNLPMLHSRASPHLKVVSVGYLAFLRTYLKTMGRA